MGIVEVFIGNLDLENQFFASLDLKLRDRLDGNEELTSVLVRAKDAHGLEELLHDLEGLGVDEFIFVFLDAEKRNGEGEFDLLLLMVIGGIGNDEEAVAGLHDEVLDAVRDGALLDVGTSGDKIRGGFRSDVQGADGDPV